MVAPVAVLDHDRSGAMCCGSNPTGIRGDDSFRVSSRLKAVERADRSRLSARSTRRTKSTRLGSGDLADSRVPVRQRRAGVSAAEAGVQVLAEGAALADVLRGDPDVVAQRDSRAVVPPAGPSRTGRVAE